MHKNVQRFKESLNEVIYVFYIGAVNHWSTFVAYKAEGDNITYFYLLDSQNYDYLNKTDE